VQFLQNYYARQHIYPFTFAIVLEELHRSLDLDLKSSWTHSRADAWTLGTLTFLGLTNDLSACVQIVKFVDDVTGVIARGGVSIMQTACSEVESFSVNNIMNFNPSKTKQMMLGSAAKSLTGHTQPVTYHPRQRN